MAGLFLTFLCGHAAFLLYSIIPGPPARDDPGNPLLDAYRLLLGGRQLWNMFDTIPVLHSLNVRFEGEDAAGQKFTAGCVLPGFRPYPVPEKARYYNAMYRLLLADGKEPYRDAYLRQAAQLLPAQQSSAAGVKWTLVVDQDFTRTLFHSRRGGPLSMLATKTFEVAKPGATSP